MCQSQSHPQVIVLQSSLTCYLALMIMFHLPAPWQLQLFVREHVEEAHQVSVMLVAFKVVGVPPDFGDHVLQTRVVCKHAVGTLQRQMENQG